MTTKIRVLGTHTVKPFGDSTHKGPFHLSAWDQIYDNLYVGPIFFYKPSQEWLVRTPTENPLVDTLKDSLSRALAHFYPLAGQLRWTDADRVELDCNSMGAKLVEAECNKELTYFQDLASKKLNLLVPVVDYKAQVHEVPLLMVRLTRFRCGGVCLAAALAHAVCDGQSAFYFFNEWARLNRGQSLMEAPYLDRTVLSARERPNNERQASFPDHIEFEKLPLLLGKQDNTEERMKETVKVVLPLTKGQLDMLKKAASLANHSGDRIARHHSRFEVVTAHIWRCACKARGHKNEQPTAFTILVDVRNRIKSVPLPLRYFGNTILDMRAMSLAGDLISNPLGFACSKIREAIEKVDEDYIWSNFKLLEKEEGLSLYRVSRYSTSEGKPFYGNPNLEVTSWLTMPILGLDFGWGNMINMSTIGLDLDGYLVLLPKDDGSVVISLGLQAAHADKFKKYFYEDIHD